MTGRMLALYVERDQTYSLIFLSIFALLGLFALIFGLLHLRPARPLDKPAYIRMLRAMRMLGTVSEDEVPSWEVIDRLRRYQRALGVASSIGVGIGVLIGAGLGWIVMWAIRKIAPYSSLNVLEAEGFGMALVASGVAFGSAIGVAIGGRRLSSMAADEVGDEDNPAGGALPRRMYLPNRLLVALGGMVAICLVFLVLVSLGILPELVLYYWTGSGDVGVCRVCSIWQTFVSWSLIVSISARLRSKSESASASTRGRMFFLSWVISSMPWVSKSCSANAWER